VRTIIDDMKMLNPSGLLKYDELDGDRGGETWSNLIDNAHIHVCHYDTIKNHQGMIYDLFGDWDYNLGSGYTENHINQGGQSDPVTLNSSDLPNDKAARGGPSPGTISCDSLDDLDGGQTWITKNIDGYMYDYTKATQSLSVEHETKEESHEYRKTSYSYTYGGRTEDYKWDGTEKQKTYKGWVERQKGEETKWDVDTGKKTYYRKFEPGINEEIKYCRDTGNMLSYGTSKQYSNTMNTFSFAWANTASASFSFSSSASFSFKAAASVSIDTSLSASATLKFNPSVSGTIDLSTGLSFVLAPFKSFHLKLEQDKIKTNIPFFQAKFATTLAKQKATEIDSTLNDIGTYLNKINCSNFKLDSGAYKFWTGLCNIMG